MWLSGALLLSVAALEAPEPPSWSRLAASLTNEELDAALSALGQERHRRGEDGEVDAPVREMGPIAFRFAHKKTYATAEPIEAAMFLQKYFGATADKSPFQHHCDNTTLEQPQTKNAYFPATAEQPHGFAIHFVRNPHKAPAYSSEPSFVNASTLGAVVEAWRGDFGGADRFDQYMDNHLGLVFSSLDPLVALWRRDGIPFICRTWFCGPGMPQWEAGTCPDNATNTRFGETGCYVEAPHGIIVEALCPLGDYNASRACLSTVDPGIFNLCSPTR